MLSSDFAQNNNHKSSTLVLILSICDSKTNISRCKQGLVCWLNLHVSVKSPNYFDQIFRYAWTLMIFLIKRFIFRTDIGFLNSYQSRSWFLMGIPSPPWIFLIKTFGNVWFYRLPHSIRCLIIIFQHVPHVASRKKNCYTAIVYG